MRNAHRIFMGKPLGKEPLGRSRTRWDDEMKMDLKKRGYQYAKRQQCKTFASDYHTLT
jgi:hypothetical protein